MANYKHRFQNQWDTAFPEPSQTLIGQSRARYFDDHPDQAPYVCQLYWCKQTHIGPFDCVGTAADPHSSYPMKRAE